MAGEERALEISQSGIETVRGTTVPATAKRYILWQPFNFERELQWASQQTGTFHNRREATYRRSTHVLNGTEDVTFDDHPYWLEHILKGGVAPVADAGVPIAYTREYLPTPAADDLKSSSWEFGTPTLPYLTNQGMVNSATFRFTPDDLAYWQMDVEVFTRKPVQGAMTPAIPDRSRKLIRAPGTKLFVHDTTIGLGQVLGRFIGGSITINNNLDFKAFAEDEDDAAANRVGRGDVTVDAQFTLEFNSDDEYEQYRAEEPVERFIRIEREGPIIHDAVRRRARFDLSGYWSSIEPDYRVNNRIITLGLGARYNEVAGYDLRAEVVNQLATLP